MKNIRKNIITYLLLSTVVGCASKTSTSSVEVSNNQSTESVQTTSESTNAVKTVNTDTKLEFSSEESSESYDSVNAVNVTLNGDSITSDKDMDISGSTITISKPGTYVFTGKLNDGQIIVNSTSSGTVRIILNGVDITSKSSAPIYIQEAESTIITVLKNTTNTLTDSANYTLNADGEPSATLFSKDNLVINGEGLLNINANYNDGITSKDDLKIINTKIVVNSVDDGIVGKDLLGLENVNITVNSGGDSLKASNDTDTNSGNVLINSGTFNLTSKADAIQAESLLQVIDGTFNISTSESSSADSYKGLKATVNLNVYGGEFNISSSDDAIHSNASVSIEGGIFNIASGDDGIHADSSIVINAGNINITKSYEGIEAANVTINDGEINVVASDDGINIAGGNDSMYGSQDSFSSGNGGLIINGGNIVVNAQGDGLDVNGSATVNGGYTIVYGPENNGNGALDYDGSFTVNGGTLIASGSSGMAMSVSENSSVYSIVIGTNGQDVSLKDSSGNVILDFSSNKSHQNLVFASDKLNANETYTAYSGSNSEIGNATLSSKISYINATQSQGGPMGGKPRRQG
ncbi:MAG: carbohydrate-binding domain-containing protein [Erysipelotrichaceae bacterium]|nr:carbohydrate-binding domain-containing protein [Erysipelotrichaceae bacterium]